MKIPATQHFIVAVLLSFFVACLPDLVLLFWNWKWNWKWNWQAFSSNPEFVTRSILWFVGFGLTGFFWMLFEGKAPPHHFGDWFVKIFIRGVFIWGPILGMLIYYLPEIFHVADPGYHDLIQYLIPFSILMGIIFTLILSIYSYFFIKG
jgi:hypothetical protein